MQKTEGPRKIRNFEWVIKYSVKHETVTGEIMRYLGSKIKLLSSI